MWNLNLSYMLHYKNHLRKSSSSWTILLLARLSFHILLLKTEDYYYFYLIVHDIMLSITNILFLRYQISDPITHQIWNYRIRSYICCWWEGTLPRNYRYNKEVLSCIFSFFSGLSCWVISCRCRLHKI